MNLDKKSSVIKQIDIPKSDKKPTNTTKQHKNKDNTPQQIEKIKNKNGKTIVKIPKPNPIKSQKQPTIVKFTTKKDIKNNNRNETINNKDTIDLTVKNEKPVAGLIWVDLQTLKEVNLKAEYFKTSKINKEELNNVNKIIKNKLIKGIDSIKTKNAIQRYNEQNKMKLLNENNQLKNEIKNTNKLYNNLEENFNKINNSNIQLNRKSTHDLNKIIELQDRIEVGDNINAELQRNQHSLKNQIQKMKINTKNLNGELSDLKNYIKNLKMNNKKEQEIQQLLSQLNKEKQKIIELNNKNIKLQKENRALINKSKIDQ